MKADKFEVIVEKVQSLDTVPSGSGVAVEGDFVFIIGDDATALFKLSLLSNEFDIFPLLNKDTSVYRMSKPEKHDLECLTMATIQRKKKLLAFGSGSVSPQRDSLLIVDLENPSDQKWVSLTHLYQSLRKRSNTGDINLEGAFITGNSLYLIDRTGNTLYGIEMNGFVEYITNGNSDVPGNIKFYEITLPLSNNVRSSLSGACTVETSLILFSASAEDTPNAYDDGKIEGSFIGVLSLKDKVKVKQLAPLKDKQGNILKDKLESIDVIGKYENGDIKAIAVADNDDGKSKLFELRIKGIN